MSMDPVLPTLIRPVKTDEADIDSQMGLLAGFLPLSSVPWWKRLFGGRGQVLALEYGVIDQQIRFQIAGLEQSRDFVVSQLLAIHPQALVSQKEVDIIEAVAAKPFTLGLQLSLNRGAELPLNTDDAGNDLPLLTAVLGYLAKLSGSEAAAVQLLVRGTNQEHWLDRIRSRMSTTDAEGKEEVSPYKSLLNEKIKQPLLEAQLRVLIGADSEEAVKARATELAGAFGVYAKAEGNSLQARTASSSWMSTAMKTRAFVRQQQTMILNLKEAASLWHLPGKQLAHITNVVWGKQLISEAPEQLPVADQLSEEQKKDVNFFAKTLWRNREATMGIWREDRTRHTYIIGKTGAGKSTLIANMAINDIRNGEGVAVIDPHGDLSEMILDYIPKRRMQDVIYLDPTLSDERSFSLNLFDVDGTAHTDVVASGIVGVFKKLYGHSWGPRLEYILRNAVLTLLYAGEATFADIPKVLTNAQFRKGLVAKIAPIDPVLAAFWTDEFEAMNERLRTEAIAPVLNKVGQFLSSQRIRHVVSENKSTISIEEIMDQKKIVLFNLSQGKLGEDTTALLGAMIITKIQLAAMKRVSMPMEARTDFYLYVDEFQNFATDSFTKILSEARKYRLNLILANQYIGQVYEDVQKAIFGNVGTVATFVVGAGDAALLARELGGVYTEEDLVNLGRFEILLKMAINGLTSAPFLATTLPLPAVVNGNKEKLVKLSLERWYRKLSGRV